MHALESHPVHLDSTYSLQKRTYLRLWRSADANAARLLTIVRIPQHRLILQTIICLCCLLLRGCLASSFEISNQQEYLRFPWRLHGKCTSTTCAFCVSRVEIIRQLRPFPVRISIYQTTDSSSYLGPTVISIVVKLLPYIMWDTLCAFSTERMSFDHPVIKACEKDIFVGNELSVVSVHLFS